MPDFNGPSASGQEALVTDPIALGPRLRPMPAFAVDRGTRGDSLRRVAMKRRRRELAVGRHANVDRCSAGGRRQGNPSGERRFGVGFRAEDESAPRDAQGSYTYEVRF